MNTNYAISFLKISCSLIFLGMGMHHLLADQPYDLLGIDTIEIHTLFGLILLFSGMLLLISGQPVANSAYLLFIPFSIILVHSVCKFIEAGYVAEQLIEFATKLLLPLVLLKEWKRPSEERTLRFSLKVIIALTFIGHGIFALGFHYVPGSFILMTQSILGLSIQQSYDFLFVIGVLDIIFALLLFFPNKKIQGISLVYLIVWGTLTSLARFVFPLVIGADFTHIAAGFSGMIYRIPHALVPIWLFHHILRERVRFLQVLKG